MEIMDAVAKKNEALGMSVCKILEKHGFAAMYAKNKEEALTVAMNLIPKGATVGVPGSVTIREIGLIDALEKRGTKAAVHWDPTLRPEDRKARFIEELTSDWFVMSTNALTSDKGVFVNIDGTGNRVGAMSWAPGKLLIILGVNKITPDIASAMARVKNTATPPNVLRLGGKAPCAVVGHCMDCDGENRVCRIVTMMERAPFGRECHVIIVGENLGY